MDFETIHDTLFKLLSAENVVKLLPSEHMFYFFPPQDKLGVFPRIHFRIENVKSNFVGDDTQEVNEARLVVDIYNKNIPPMGIGSEVVKSMLVNNELLNSELITSSDTFDKDDNVFGKHLVFQFYFKY